ncbi:MAG: HNH endonuclease [Chloroflexi bacterium]|nr:HNH endonuclease [Chloroflexota bacterium]MBU1661771.1 HNH endonuclease [Chloroflexota bacterium]
MTETAVGGELSVDHYHPKSAGGGDDDDNLVYACVKCNQFKGGYWPDSDDITHQWRVLHPLLDSLNVHLIEDEQTGYLQALTETGRFHIALLRLNRPQLVGHRLAHRLQNIMREKQQLLAQQNVELEKTITSQERYIALLEEQLEHLRSSY